MVRCSGVNGACMGVSHGPGLDTVDPHSGADQSFVYHRKERTTPMAKMWLLIGLLILASAGCTRRDWVGNLLVLTDVSGTWSGSIDWRGPPNFSLTLQQAGARVTGESSAAPRGSPLNGKVEGLVNGEVFGFSIMGGVGSPVRGVVTIDGDEMAGELAGLPQLALDHCPCRVRLRRSGPAPTPRPQ